MAGVSIIPLGIMFFSFALFLAMSFYYKNILLVFISGVFSLLIGASVWSGGIVEQTGLISQSNTTNISVNVTQENLIQTAVYSQVPLGFNHSYLGTTFIVLGVLLFIIGTISYFDPKVFKGAA